MKLIAIIKIFLSRELTVSSFNFRLFVDAQFSQQQFRNCKSNSIIINIDRNNFSNYSLWQVSWFIKFLLPMVDCNLLHLRFDDPATFFSYFQRQQLQNFHFKMSTISDLRSLNFCKIYFLFQLSSTQYFAWFLTHDPITFQKNVHWRFQSLLQNIGRDWEFHALESRWKKF